MLPQSKWMVEKFQSGTVNVRLVDQSESRIFVNIHAGSFALKFWEGHVDAIKGIIAEELCCFLNGGNRPPWVMEFRQSDKYPFVLQSSEYGMLRVMLYPDEGTAVLSPAQENQKLELVNFLLRL